MRDGVRVAAWSVVVHLGQAVIQPVTAARRRDHAWLARMLNGLGVDARFREDSAYLSLASLTTDPESVKQAVAPPADPPDNATIIIDLSDAPYEQLKEPMLGGIAESIGGMLAGRPRTIAVLLRQLPQESLLWALEQYAGDGPGRVVVVDDEGELRNFGSESRRGFLPLQRDWPERRAQQRGGACERFERRVVARLGHFATAHGRSCTPVWQDMRSARSELVECLGERMAEVAASAQRVIVCGPCSRVLRVAAISAADLHGLETAFAAEPADVNDLACADGNFLVFEYVRSGDTLGDFRRAIPSWRAPVVRQALAVMAAPLAVGLRHPDLVVDVLAVRGDESVRQEACDRCAVSTPRLADPTLPDPSTGIDAATMWWMLDRVPWGPERYGHPETGRYPYIPDFRAVFSTFGDWIAVKYEELLRELGLVDDLVVVCPAEPAVRGLVKHLGARLANQLVPVELERELIAEVAATPAAASDLVETLRKGGSGEAWERQLVDLGGRPADEEAALAVVALDEFSASGTTARGVVTLLAAFDVSVDAYLPFVDWSVGLPAAGMVRRSLYSFYNPRPVT